MPALASEFPVSLRSWPLRDGDPSKSLPSLIQRINSERGGFLGLNEDVLRQEIAKAEADAGGDDDDGAILEEKDEKPDRIKDIVTARDEMLVQIEYVVLCRKIFHTNHIADKRTSRHCSL
jgi:mediator of RNA polymerase II transcription subunit 17